MTQHTPPTELELDEIDTRALAATDGPWERYEDYGPYFYANTSGEYLRGVGDLNFGVGEQADADEAFVRHAQEDVTVLLAEVRRLRARALTASEYNAAWHAVEGAAGEDGADPGTVLHAVLDRLGIEWQGAARPAAPAAVVGGVSGTTNQ